jgi:hypothetical protein
MHACHATETETETETDRNRDRDRDRDSDRDRDRQTHTPLTPIIFELSAESLMHAGSKVQVQQ